MTNREPCSRWANESSTVWPPRVGVNGSVPELDGFAQSLVEDHAQMILLSHERQCFSRTNRRPARRRPPCIRFAVL